MEKYSGWEEEEEEEIEHWSSGMEDYRRSRRELLRVFR